MVRCFPMESFWRCFTRGAQQFRALMHTVLELEFSSRYYKIYNSVWPKSRLGLSISYTIKLWAIDEHIRGQIMARNGRKMAIYQSVSIRNRLWFTAKNLVLGSWCNYCRRRRKFYGAVCSDSFFFSHDTAIQFALEPQRVKRGNFVTFWLWTLNFGSVRKTNGL